MKFPDEYHAEELQGRDAMFDVQVKDVKEKQLPELDDDFASEASEFDTLDELRADIHHKLEHAQEHTIEDEFRQAAVDAAVAEADIDLPDELVTARAEEMWERTERVLRAQGVEPEAYLTASGRTREQMVEEAKEDARRDARTRERAGGRGRGRGHRGVGRRPARGARARRPSARAPSPTSCSRGSKETGRDVPVRRELRLRRAVDVIADSAKPIEPGTARAREQIWTPEKQAKEEGSSQLWTPGAGDPPGPSRLTPALRGQDRACSRGSYRA